MLEYEHAFVLGPVGAVPNSSDLIWKPKNLEDKSPEQSTYELNILTLIRAAGGILYMTPKTLNRCN
jgi:hypothetical protein